MGVSRLVPRVAVASHLRLRGPLAGRRQIAPCRESLCRVYLVGIGNGIRVRGYGGRGEGGEEAGASLAPGGGGWE